MRQTIGTGRRGVLKLAAGSAVAAAAWQPAAPAIAQARPTTLRFGGPMPLTTNYGQAMTRLSDEAKQRSGGRLNVQVFPGGQLGGLQDMISAVQLGTQSMIMVTPSWIGNYAPKVNVLTLLYLSQSHDKQLVAMDGAFGQKMDGYAQAAGFKLLAWWDGGPRHMLNNVRPINTPDDMQGLKIRAQSNQVWLRSLRALGSNPVILDYPEIYLGLQQHTVDGYENPIPDAVSGKFYEVTKYLSLTAHLFDMFVVVMNKAQWDRLSPADQQIMQESATIATTWQRSAEQAEVGKALDLMRTKMQVNDLSPEHHQMFADKMKPVYASFNDEIGRDLIDEAMKQFS